MIGTMCAVNGKQQLKTGLCPAVERQGRVKVVRFQQLEAAPNMRHNVRNPSISTY